MQGPYEHNSDSIVLATERCHFPNLTSSCASARGVKLCHFPRLCCPFTLGCPRDPDMKLTLYYGYKDAFAIAWYSSNIHVQSHLCTVTMHCALEKWHLIYSKPNTVVHSLTLCCRPLAGSAEWIHPQCIAVMTVTVCVWQVRYLKIIEKSGYQALPWVRYITQNGGKTHSSLFLYFCLCFSQRCLIVAKYLQCSADDERLVLSAELKLFCEKRMFRTDACEMVKHR